MLLHLVGSYEYIYLLRYNKTDLFYLKKFILSCVISSNSDLNFFSTLFSDTIVGPGGR